MAGAFIRPGGQKTLSQTESSTVTPVTMNSKEIADLTGKQHKNVLRDIRKMLDKANLRHRRFEDKYLDGNNRTCPCFKLPKRQLDELISNYDFDNRMKVMARWQQLEVQGPAVPVAVSKPKPHLTLVPERIAEKATPMTELQAAGMGDGLTMSSREIAKLTGATHANTLATVRSLIERGVISGNETPYQNAQNGQMYSEYQLTYRDTMVVASGYSVELRAKVIDRWQVLEAQVAKPVANLNDPASLRGLLLGYTEQVLQLEHKITVDKPKVEFYDEFVESKELHDVAGVAKTLGTGEIRLFRYLREHKILIGGTGDDKNMPYQKYLNSGRMDVKYNNHTVPETGEVKIRPKPLFTRKGVDWIREFVKEHGRDGL